MKDDLALYGGKPNEKEPENGPGSLVLPMKELKDAITSIGKEK
jgi:hypothetical protein